MIKALIFDMDGLMIDSERLYFETEREIASSFGKIVNNTTLWKMMGRKPIESLKIFADDLDLPMSPDELLEMRDEMMLERLKNDLVPMKGLREILNTFDGRLEMAVATGAVQLFLDLVLDQLKIRHYFKFLQASDDIERGKPDPEIYLKTIDALNVLPSECVILEDSSNGALAGKRAGGQVIAVPTEYTRDQDFSFVDISVMDLFHAIDHIESMM